MFNTQNLQTQICDIMKCPPLKELTETIEETIETLKQSKDSYRSKQLALIRAKLEKLLNNIQKI